MSLLSVWNIRFRATVKDGPETIVHDREEVFIIHTKAESAISEAREIVRLRHQDEEVKVELLSVEYLGTEDKV